MITVVGDDLRDIHVQLGRIGPSFDILIKFRRSDNERNYENGGIITFAHNDVPIECLTNEALIQALAAVLDERRAAWIERTAGGTKEDTPR